jgi:hypothetical protein
VTLMLGGGPRDRCQQWHQCEGLGRRAVPHTGASLRMGLPAGGRAIWPRILSPLGAAGASLSLLSKVCQSPALRPGWAAWPMATRWGTGREPGGGSGEAVGAGVRQQRGAHGAPL